MVGFYINCGTVYMRSVSLCAQTLGRKFEDSFFVNRLKDGLESVPGEVCAMPRVLCSAVLAAVPMH